MINLDDFKAINDNFGHDTGDRVLLNTVKQLQGFFPRPLLSEKPPGKKFHFDPLYAKMKHIVSNEGFYIYV